MAEAIIDGWNNGNFLKVNQDGSINTNFTGSITIGSVSANVDSIYVQSGDNINISNYPTTYPGSVSQSTNPWIILGSVHTVNSVDTGSKSWVIDTTPIVADRNNPYYTFIYMTSGTATGVTGSRIGSIVQFIGAGSYVQRLIYSNDLIVNVGSWT